MDEPRETPPASSDPAPSDPAATPAEELGQTMVWVKQAKDGDREAFETLFAHLTPALYSWADMRIRPAQRGQLDPGDVVQEVFLRAVRAFEGFEVDGPSIRAWLFRIAKNVLLEAGRAARKHGTGSSGSETRELALQGIPDSITSASMRLARDEQLAAFREAVEALSEEDRALVVHCGMEGMSRAEVAERLGLGVEAVTKRWQRLRARLEERGLPEMLLALAH